jgi:hypothetical protein
MRSRHVKLVNRNSPVIHSEYFLQSSSAHMWRLPLTYKTGASFNQCDLHLYNAISTILYAIIYTNQFI